YNVLNPSAGGGDPRGGQDFADLIGRASAAGLGVIAIRIFAAGAAGARPERHPIAGNPGGALVAGGEYGADVERARQLLPLVAELGLESPLELALRFVLANPAVSTALTGISELAHLEAILRWAERGPLDTAAVGRVLRAGH